MPVKDEDLHGMVPDNSAMALVMLDVINDLEFEGVNFWSSYALPMAH